MKNTFLLLFLTAFIVCVARDEKKTGRKMVRFVHNASPKGADLDVIDPNGSPLFRILIPESVTAKNLPDRSLINHIVPGEWGETEGIYWGKIANKDWIEAKIAFMPLKKGTLILFGVRNLSGQTLEGVAMDVCTAVSHIPSPNGAWINPDFVGVSGPPDRDLAGRYWFEKVAPFRLKAFSNGEWIIAHPHPQQPSSVGVPAYKPFIYLDSPAFIMAAESINGKERIFQAWDTPAKARCAFPGNSCLHLEPLLSEKLIPNQMTFIRGEIAVTKASWASISKWNAEQFRHEYEAMKTVLDNLSSKP